MPSAFCLLLCVLPPRAQIRLDHRVLKVVENRVVSALSKELLIETLQVRESDRYIIQSSCLAHGRAKFFNSYLESRKDSFAWPGGAAVHISPL